MGAGGGGGGGAGGAGDGLAAAYAAGVADAMAGRGELGYPAHDAGFGTGSDGGFAGGGLGGDMSAFDAYAFSPDFSMTNPANFNPGFDAPNPTNFTGLGFNTQGFEGGREGGGLADIGNFGFGDFSHGPGFGTSPSPGELAAPAPPPAPSGGGGGGGGNPAGGGPGFSSPGGPTGFGQEGPGPDVTTPAYAPGHNGTPGLDNQLASMGWEGFNAYGAVPGMNNLNSWRGPQGGIHPLADFIRAGWSNQRLYTPEFLADTFTDVGTSPMEAYEQLAGRGHVPTPMYPGVQDLNTGGGSPRPMFPSPSFAGSPFDQGNQGTQPFNGVQPISPNMIPPDPNSMAMGGLPQVMDLRTMRMMGLV